MHHPHAALPAPVHSLCTSQRQRARWPLRLAGWGASASAALLAGCASPRVDHPLQYAPAESIYVAANIEPLPDAGRQFVRQVLEPLRPAWAALVQALTTAELKTAQDRRLADFIRYLDATGNAEGLTGFGVSAQALYALYEIDLQPVLRITLSDAARMRTLVGEVQKALDVEVPAQTLGEIEYWRIALDQIDARALREGAQQLSEQLPHALPEIPELPDTPADATASNIIIAIAGEQLVLALDVSNRVPLARLLGAEKPTTTMADSKALHAANERHGLTPYGSLWVETARLLPLLGLGPDAELAARRNLLDHTLDAACAAEVTGFAAKVPELIAGNATLDAKHLHYRFTAALEPALHDDLRPLLAPMPGQHAPAAAIEMGMSLRLDRLAALVHKQLLAIQNTPFQCAQLQFLNAAATQPSLMRVLAPLYALGPTATGVTIRLIGADFTSDEQGQPEFVALIGSDNPQALLAFITMADPALRGLALQPGGPAAQVDITALDDFNQPMWLAMGERAIGIAVGARAEQQLLPLLQTPPGEAGALTFSRYDVGQLFDMIEPLLDAQWRSLQGEMATVLQDLPPDDPERTSAQSAEQMLQTTMAALEAFIRTFSVLEDQVSVGAQGLDWDIHYRLR